MCMLGRWQQLVVTMTRVVMMIMMMMIMMMMMMMMMMCIYIGKVMAIDDGD